MLYPAKVPYILRPTGIAREYTLIREAYVQGIMYGEILEKLLPEAIKTRNYTSAILR